MMKLTKLWANIDWIGVVLVPDNPGSSVGSMEGIRNIILFGSVARGYFDKESDIDVFVDTTRKVKEDQIEVLLEKFKKTQVYKNWRLKGISREIKPLAGDLKSREWGSLHASICSDGILLYGKYESSPKGLKHWMIFSFGNIKDAKKRVNIHRNLFGYKIKGHAYSGLVEKLGGEKLGPGVLIVPLGEAAEARKVFKKFKVPVRIFEIWK